MKSNETMFKDAYSLIPEVFDIATNYQSAWEGVGGVSFLAFLGNTVFVTVLGMAGCVIISLFAAYAFTRIKFKGSKFWFSCVMVTMMIPSQVMVVPQYIILKKLNLIDTRVALALPWFFGTAFFIFMLVQFFRGVPKDLDEAAEIDGCGRISILFRILVPVVKPALVTASIFAFYWIWQDFFQPLIFMSTPSKYTLSLALNMFLDPNAYNNYGGLFAMSVLSLLPTLIFFIIFQRYLVDGIAMDGIKG
jgi:multiple sugar transport system permease protein